jgi:hypothetical protein
VSGREIAVRPVAGANDRAAWLDLPRRVYPDWRFRGGQPRHERALLAGTHPLSPDLEMTALLAHTRRGPVGRCAVTLRDGDPVARIGFFECLDLRAGPVLLDAAEAWAAGRGRVIVRGPFDPDFWVGYRMRLDHFGTPPFFGEPYNRPEYPGIWHDAGYDVVQRYSSRIVTPDAVRNASRAGASAPDLPPGVEIRPLGRRVGPVFGPIRDMIQGRFSLMAEFQPIRPEQFDALMRPLGALLDPRGTQIAWEGDTVVGFATVTPDFGRWLDRGPVRARLGGVRHRTRSRAYVATYMATVRPGIGRALIARGLAYAAGRGATGIGALIHESAPTRGYFPDVVSRRHHYAVFAKHGA